MNILTAIKREERKLEKQMNTLQRRLQSLKDAAKALGNSEANGLDRGEKRLLSAAARAKISAAAKRRWAKVRAGSKKATN